jgi:hypothetical protein
MPPTAITRGNYSGYCFLAEWPELVVAIDKAEARLRAAGRPKAANLVLMAYAELRDRLLLLAQDMAKLGTKMLTEEEKNTRVGRPDTQGMGGPRLQDNLVVEPVAQALLPGTIGINNEDLLDRNVPWWITNEIGSTTQIGRKIFGLFYNPGGGDMEPPDALFDRQHALFMPAPPESGAGGATIMHGIPARHFVTRAAPKIEQEWLTAAGTIKADFIAKLDAASAVME